MRGAQFLSTHSGIFQNSQKWRWLDRGWGRIALSVKFVTGQARRVSRRWVETASSICWFFKAQCDVVTPFSLADHERVRKTSLT